MRRGASRSASLGRDGSCANGSGSPGSDRRVSRRRVQERQRHSAVENADCPIGRCQQFVEQESQPVGQQDVSLVEWLRAAESATAVKETSEQKAVVGGGEPPKQLRVGDCGGE